MNYGTCTGTPSPHHDHECRGGSRISLRGVLLKEHAQSARENFKATPIPPKNRTDLRAYSMVASATDQKIMLR